MTAQRAAFVMLNLLLAAAVHDDHGASAMEARALAAEQKVLELEAQLAGYRNGRSAADFPLLEERISALDTQCPALDVFSLLEKRITELDVECSQSKPPKRRMAPPHWLKSGLTADFKALGKPKDEALEAASELYGQLEDAANSGKGCAELVKSTIAGAGKNVQKRERFMGNGCVMLENLANVPENIKDIFTVHADGDPLDGMYRDAGIVDVMYKLLVTEQPKDCVAMAKQCITRFKTDNPLIANHLDTLTDFCLSHKKDDSLDENGCPKCPECTGQVTEMKVEDYGELKGKMDTLLAQLKDVEKRKADLIDDTEATIEKENKDIAAKVKPSKLAIQQGQNRIRNIKLMDTAAKDLGKEMANLAHDQRSLAVRMVLNQPQIVNALDPKSSEEPTPEEFRYALEEWLITDRGASGVENRGLYIQTSMNPCLPSVIAAGQERLFKSQLIGWLSQFLGRPEVINIFDWSSLILASLGTEETAEKDVAVAVIAKMGYPKMSQVNTGNGLYMHMVSTKHRLFNEDSGFQPIGTACQ